MMLQMSGVLPGSATYRFTPSGMASQYLYYLTQACHFFCQQGYGMEHNQSSNLLLVYVRHGEMLLDYEQGQYNVRSGEVFLVDCTLTHHFFSIEGLEILCFHFDGVNSHDLCRQLVTSNGGPVFRGPQNEKIERLIFETLTRFGNNQFISESDCSNIIYSAICSLALQDERPPDANASINKAIAYIRDHVISEMTLAEIANHVCLSPFYFARIFKEETGFSPLNYAKRLRMEMARNLLQTTSQSVETIAYAIGYGSSTSFSNAFAKHVGMSPRQYRKVSFRS